jgi:ABC-type phosphate transport system permease subunit
MSHTRHGFVNRQCSSWWVSSPVGTFPLIRGKRPSAPRAVLEADRPRLELSTAPSWHRAAEWALRVMAGAAAIAIVLILVFIAKEAAPLFYDREVLAEVSLSKMLLPQLWPGYDEAATVWQPVSEVPKYAIWPLVLGTLKVTVVAMIVAVPLGVGSALYVSQYARPRVTPSCPASRFRSR